MAFIGLSSVNKLFMMRSLTVRNACGLKISSACTYCTNSSREINLTEVPLSVAPHGFESIQYCSPHETDHTTKISRLDNGLTVASQKKMGMHCTVGVIIKAGPRYESAMTSGVSHFVEKLGFHSTTKYESRNAIQSELENCGAIFDCQIGKDVIIYALSGYSNALPNLVDLLSEVVLRPRVLPEEVAMAGQSIGYELESMQMKPPPDNILTELLHSAAYRCNSVGLPRYCPEENLNKIGRKEILTYLASFYRPERMIIAGVGVDHDDLMKCAQSSFLQKEATWESAEVQSASADLLDKKLISHPDNSIAQYTGGMVTVERDLEQYHSPMPEFAHLVLGLESCGTTDDQFVTACLLNTMMGGGGSFSSGGPGKGMYSRLYLNVLNQHYWVNSAQCVHHSYTDTGVLAIVASSEPRDLGRLAEVIGREMRLMAGPVGEEELCRAKRQLESMLLMNLEMRPVIFEDLARQVLTTGVKQPPQYWMDRIERITEQDIRDLVHRMFQSKPAVVGFGRLNRMPTYEEISQNLTHNKADRFMPKIFSGFR